jgi:MFS family permease
VNWIILAGWRGIGLVPFLVFPLVDEKGGLPKKRDDSLKSVITNRGFYLYFVVWFMFMLVDRSEDPTLRFVLDDLRYNVLAPIIASVSALIAGILADRIGRKKVLLPGFVIFGVAYALIGLFPDYLIARYFFITIESISGGILLVSFILILWGDLSEHSSREKYYGLGLIPFFLTSIIQLFSGPFFMEIENTNAFTLAVFFLFMALLPLWVAPETLPEKNIELRRLKSFAEEARKTREKFETENE